MEAFAVITVVIGSVTLLFLHYVLSAIVRGFVLASLWSWFVVPMGAPAMPLTIAMGVGIMVGYLTFHQVRTKDNLEGKEALMRIGEMMLMSLVLSGFTFGLGWVVHLFL